MKNKNYGKFRNDKYYFTLNLPFLAEKRIK